MSEEKKRSGFFGSCLGVFAGLGIFGMAIFGCLAVVCVGVIVILAASQDAQEKDAVEANAGRGEKDNPIAAGEPVVFDDAEVTAIRMVRHANEMVAGFNSFNDDPAAGTEFVLVWFDVACKAEECNRVGSGFRLVDANGREWEEPDKLIVLDDNLDNKDGITGSRYGGWQVFEFPPDGTIETIMVRWNNGSWLYVEPPEEA